MWFDEAGELHTVMFKTAVLAPVRMPVGTSE
jgi:hypothetical protein